MKIQAYNYLNKKVKYVKETKHLYGVLIMSSIACCLCCSYDTGGNLFCK